MFLLTSIIITSLETFWSVMSMSTLLSCLALIMSTIFFLMLVRAGTSLVKVSASLLDWIAKKKLPLLKKSLKDYLFGSELGGRYHQRNYLTLFPRLVKFCSSFQHRASSFQRYRVCEQVNTPPCLGLSSKVDP